MSQDLINYIPGNYFVIESEIMEAFDSKSDTDDKDAKTGRAEIFSFEPDLIAEQTAKKEQRLASLQDLLAGMENFRIGEI